MDEQKPRLEPVIDEVESKTTDDKPTSVSDELKVETKLEVIESPPENKPETTEEKEPKAKFMLTDDGSSD